MKGSLVIISILLGCIVNAQLPCLKKNAYGVTQMVVNGKPFLMLAGEVYNSSASDRSYMEKTMMALRDANFNTVFVPLSWELIEPAEQQFDFASINQMISIARKNNLKLVFLWLATWKNGISPYAPIWLMQNTEKYWRVKDSSGRNTQTLSAFCTATLEADKNAYCQVIKHIAKVDAKENTVIAMQVENEVGVFGQTRDFSAHANEAYANQVPQQLIQYLQKNEATLEIEIKTAWKDNGSKTSGSWTEVFGKKDFTDLFFMAWQYGSFVNKIAAEGKKILALPTYVNCWMPATPGPNPRPNYTKPGTYPSGGPIIMVADIWKAAAPAIDMLAPDIYGNDFDLQAGFFHRSDNPLFIPETKAIEGRATYAFANHNAISFSPFGIDNLTDSMKAEYGMLKQLSTLILEYQGSGKIKAFYRNENDTIGGSIQLNKEVLMNVHLTRPYFRRNEDLYVNGKFPSTYGIFIQTSDSECIVAGKNIYISAISTNPKKEVWLRDVWEGNFINGKWKRNALMNGDEAGFLWSKKTPVYRVKTNPTIYPPLPTPPAIFKMKAMVYDL